jgi:ribonuclease HI
MNVTVLADASYCPETQIGAYGFWIACDRGKLPGGDAFEGCLTNSIQAEMMAIGEAIFKGIQANLIRNKDVVLVQTDCKSAIQLFNKTERRELPQWALTVWDYYRNIEREWRLQVTFKHVKGHTDRKTKNEPRFAANRACDSRARQAMRRARDVRRSNVKQLKQDKADPVIEYLNWVAENTRKSK